MHVFIINMAKDLDRRASISQQMDELGLEYEYFTAIVGNDLTTIELKQSYNHSKAMRTQGRDLTPSEIGCALSHIAIYRIMLDRNIPMALILEDDTILSKNTKAVLGNIESHINKEEPIITLLSPVKETKGIVCHMDEGYQVECFKRGYFTNGYVITETSARAMIKFLYPVGDVADCWRRLHRHRVIDIYAVRPALAIQNRDNFDSMTNAEIMKYFGGRPLWLRYLLKIRRAFWLSIDQALAFFVRHFRPYAGLSLKGKR